VVPDHGHIRCVHRHHFFIFGVPKRSEASVPARQCQVSQKSHGLTAMNVARAHLHSHTHSGARSSPRPHP
jgi:hypothetical protein